MSKFGVTPKKEEELYVHMKELGLSEDDIEEKFIRSSGKGGQKVNKSSSCVQLRHIPTGIIVKYQKERTQNLNRFFARRVLIERIDNMINKAESKQTKKYEKIAKQKHKRKKRSKLKINNPDQ